MNKPIEILAPTGSWESLEAGVFAGADAVYLGGTSFSARAAAKNYDNQQLIEAVDFCHRRDVAVYVTINTLLKDSEFQQAMDFVRFLCSIAVDAVIVQDIGLFARIKACAPNLPIHASTQMSIHNPAGVRFLEEQGARRVVLARELSLKEIEEIARETDIELEVFVHGALCMSVSGQCYFSAMLGGRSGNRGMCAQTCRLPFDVGGGTGHDLSLKDLSIVDRLSKLQAAGVASAKIEGRMKRPEYVAAVVDACVYAKNGLDIPEEKFRDMQGVFNRNGFTDGYFTEDRGRQMFGTRKSSDVADSKLLARTREIYRTEKKRIALKAELKQQADTVCLTVFDKSGNNVSVSKAIDPGAVPLSADRAAQQLNKTGGTAFYMEDMDIPENGVPLYIKSFNALRREALELLEQDRARRVPITFVDSKDNRSKRHDRSGFKLRAAFRNLEQIPEQFDRYDKIIDKIYLPIKLGAASVKASGIQKETTIIELPRAFFGLSGENWLKNEMADFMKYGYTDFACGNLGSLQLCKELGAKAHGLYGLNIANGHSLNFFQELGLKSAELSMELKHSELPSGDLETGLMLYGRQSMMLLRNCPIKNGKSCGECGGSGRLRDRMGKDFPVVCGRDYAEVLNSLPLYLADIKDRFFFDFGIIRFTVENSVECGKLLQAVLRQEKPDIDYTRGLFQKGME